MNAGGAFGSIGDVVHSVGCLNERGETIVYPASELQFRYRETNIPDPIILWAAFNLEEDNPGTVRERVLEIFSYKKSTQPLADSSAGCAFKNPLDPETGEHTSAGRLIDQAGLKGTLVGRAQVSPMHGNFVLVKPGGTATDVLRLIEKIKTTVMEVHSVELSTEVVVWKRS